jgi:Co/Zn/Cd efflux system component
MRSAWICTRNDVLGNLAVLLAALGVFGTGTGWPDVIVAAVMAGLALQGAAVVLRQSRRELCTTRSAIAWGLPLISIRHRTPGLDSTDDGLGSGT